MAYFERTSTLVQAWRVPELGSVADEVLPQWIISRLQSGDLSINAFGGFSYSTSSGLLVSYAGDYIVLTEEDVIEFCKATEFNLKFKLLDESLAA